MLGSSDSIACANIMLNSAVAESLRQYADVLEHASDFNDALHALIRDTVKKHKRIIFNGNGYDAAWIKEATENRGLLNYRTTPDCMPHLTDEKNVAMLKAHGVYSEAELKARCEINLENYCKTVTIEANTMLYMATREILPAVEKYAASVASSAAKKKALAPELACSYEHTLVSSLSGLTDRIAEACAKLSDTVAKLKYAYDVTAEAYAIRDTVIPAMNELRAVADEAETLTASEYWPFPTYGDLLFGVK